MADARGEMVPQLDDEWDLAKRSLKSDSRYFNNNIRDSLDTIFSGVEMFIDYDKQSIIKEFDQDSSNFQVFRARCFDSKEESKIAIENNELGPPPAEISTAGRMNVAGIPVFYGATSSRLARAEARPSVGSYVVVAQFEVLKKIKLLDVEGLRSIFLSATRYFDLEDEVMQLAAFLDGFGSEITKTVSPKEEPLEYLVTQAISEYLAEVSNIDVNGLIYDSSQAIEEDKNNGKYEKNIMLFNKFSNLNESSSDFPPILRMRANSPAAYRVTGADFSISERINFDKSSKF